ncbi:carboxypeptidase-like regulatory domain-containing protein [Ancylomarina sp. YFZ004]
MIKTLFVFLFLLFGTHNLMFAESIKHTITGKVIDSISKQPIINAAIFISGTTIGTTTNKNGEFKLESPYVPFQLVIMHLSYKLVVLDIKSAGNFHVELINRPLNLSELSVCAKNMRRRNLRLFYKYFMWNSNKQQVKVLNDSVLSFRRDGHDFHAYCKTPLLLENKYLGYNIKLIIQDFHVCKKQMSSGKKLKLKSGSGIGVFKLKGFYYYKPADIENPQKKLVIKRNRRKHYFGSLRHFLTSMYQNKFKENGYDIKAKLDSTKRHFVLTSEEKNLKHYKFGTDTLRVTYFENQDEEPINLNELDGVYYIYTSTLLSLGKEFEVRANGTSRELSFELKGPMGQRSPANSLPDDYTP